MKLVIDIPEIDYNTYKHFGNKGTYSERIIANGTPYEERPKGEWIESPYEELRKHGYFKCSNCGVGFKRFDKEYQCYDNFCPNCGAKMDL